MDRLAAGDLSRLYADSIQLGTVNGTTKNRKGCNLSCNRGGGDINALLLHALKPGCDRSLDRRQLPADHYIGELAFYIVAIHFIVPTELGGADQVQQLSLMELNFHFVGDRDDPGAHG